MGVDFVIKDLALDTKGDLYFSSDGDVIVTDSLRQAIQIKLRWALGEWVYNTELGIPYFEKFLVKKPDTQEIANIVRSALMEFTEVKNVESCTVDFNEAERKCVVRFVVQTDKEIIESEVEYA